MLKREGNEAPQDMFKGRFWDLCLYFFFYCFIPFYTSLQALNELDCINGLPGEVCKQCFYGILVASTGCIYDAINRIEKGSIFLNGTLYYGIILPNLVVAVYCVMILFINEAVLSEAIINNWKELKLFSQWVLRAYYLVWSTVLFEAAILISKMPKVSGKLMAQRVKKL